MKTGVIIGRFQTPYLHEAHIKLIEHVRKNSDQVIILLGLSPVKGSDRNPLDYQTRVEMLKNKFPSITIGYVKDTRCNGEWSKNVDRVVSDLSRPGNSVTLFGSRDSFIPYYSGKFPTKELDSETTVSATVLREEAKRQVSNTADFRAGVIYGVSDRYPIVYTTVDVAILSEDGSKLLLARKKGEAKFRFVGGFSCVNSSSFEEDARREVNEETGISITDPKYLGSFLIDDWRYRNEGAKIKTIFFTAFYQFGKVEAKDDIEFAAWFDIDKITINDIMEEHVPLLNKLLNQ